MLQRFYFRKKDRLTKQKIIKQLFQEGTHINVYPFRIFILKVEKSLTARFQVLISVPRKLFKKAACRNLIKRRMREAYRLNKKILSDIPLRPEIQVAIAFVYIANEIHDYGFIHQKMVEALKRVNQDIHKLIP